MIHSATLPSSFDQPDPPLPPPDDSESPGAAPPPAIDWVSVEEDTAPAQADLEMSAADALPAAVAASAGTADPVAAGGAGIPIQLGPLGRRRSPALLAALSVITLGIHPGLWTARVNREMRDFDPRMHVRPARAALALLAPALLTLLIALGAAARQVAERLGHPVDLPVTSRVSVWLLAAPALLPLLVLLISPCAVAAAMTMERVRVVEDRAGVDPDQQVRPVAALRALLIPVAGVATLEVIAQRRLNRVWSLMR